MSAFLRSIKADLLDRRLLAGVVVLTLALAGALAYAVLGGNSTAVSVAPVAPAGTGSLPVAAAGISISQGSPKSADASTETPSSSYQRGGPSRNPFASPPAAKAASTSAKGSSSSHTTNSSSTPSASKPAPQPASKKPAPVKSTPAPAPKKSKPKATATPDRVSVLFGEVPAGTPTQDLRLTPYENLAPLTPLPSTKLPLLVYSGTAANGKLASFARAGEVVLRGSAACSPSPAQCLTIELEAGDSEQVEYLPAGGKPVVYELEIVSISPGRS